MESVNNYQQEEVREKLRCLLNRDKVRLWENPYTDNDGTKLDIPVTLVTKYSAELDLEPISVKDALEALRQHALDKLASQKRYRESGIASLKIKMAGQLPPNFKEENPSLTLTLDLSLKVKGHELKALLGERCQQSTSRLKLIAAGKVVEDGEVLEQQGLKNMSKVMCLVLTESEAAARAEDERMAKVAKTRQAAELLSSYKDGGESDNTNYYLQIADQTGKRIDLPDEERKALVFAMTLHEKGRAAIKHKDYGEAVLLLLEADKEFRKCRANILNAVDNYALVCLDIVWCYLCLESLDNLPDAETRLKSSEECFHKSYGANMERLAKVKGETGVELALFLRLHLLQGILAFHQHKMAEAKTFLSKAETDLKSLQVDEDKMTQVLMMGFSPQEARLGLRACHGDVQSAIAHIMKKNDERKERQAKEQEEKKNQAIAKRLGKTANGEPVNVQHYNSLQSMGYGKGASAAALRQTNNDIMMAIQALHDHPELLTLPDPDPPEFKVTHGMIARVTAMGFDEAQARAALHHFQCDVHRSVEGLLSVGGIVPQQWIDAIPSTSSPSSDTSGSGSSSPAKSPEEEQKEKEAIDEIVHDLPQGEEDHLDLDLDQESQYLQYYLARISSLT